MEVDSSKVVEVDNNCDEMGNQLLDAELQSDVDSSCQEILNITKTDQFADCNSKRNKKLSPSQTPQPRQCKFYVERKRRRCKIWALRHDDYCGEHANNDFKNQLEEYRRVPCPYDPKHTCYEKLLDDHMKKCNFRPVVPQYYFKKDINSSSGAVVEQKGIREMTAEEIKRLISIVRTVHNDKIPKLEERYGIHPDLGTELLRTDVGDISLKHVSQNSSLIKLMEDVGLLNDLTCYVEFGSGKGALTYWLAKVTTKASQKVNQSKFVLVDKMSHRHKKENKLKDTDIDVERIRIDILDFKLDTLPSVQNSENSVGITKHLCGAATDIALKCLLETNEHVEKVRGLTFATCCHHRCDWPYYVGQDFLLEWGFQINDFKALCGVATWAVCGTGNARFDDSGDSDNNHEVINNPIYAELDLSTSERRKLGIYAKEILDYGRVCYIKKFCNLDAFVCHYVDLSTTYENHAIVAHRN